MRNGTFSCREDLRNVKHISTGRGGEGIITIMIAITPKSEEKCREAHNCFSSFQKCLSVTDEKKASRKLMRLGVCLMSELTASSHAEGCAAASEHSVPQPRS